MLKTKGCSSFNLSYDNNQQGWFVTKKTTSNIGRLKKQCQKQKEYSSYIESDTVLKHLFTVPSVISETENSFTMPFYNGQTFLDIIEKGNILDCKNIIDNLLLLIIKEFNDCRIDVISSNVFLNKLSEIKEKTNNPIIDKIKVPTEIVLPIGYCHGDLTFSNCIFSNKIILLDFLDCYIETPFQDISKILQELYLQWNYLTSTSSHDKIKIDLAYKYISVYFQQNLQTLFNNIEYNEDIINLFYQITLLRILPYITNKEIETLIISKVEETL